MGTSQSSFPVDGVTEESLQALEKSTGFTRHQLIRLGNRFKALDTFDMGYLSDQNFLSIPELALHPMGLRLVAAFGEQDEHVTFEKFCAVLATFRPEAAVEDKLDLIFQLYDTDGDGKIGRQELYSALERMVGKSVGQKQLAKLCEKILRDARRGRVPESARELEYMTREDFGWAMQNARLKGLFSIKI